MCWGLEMVVFGRCCCGAGMGVEHEGERGEGEKDYGPAGEREGGHVSEPIAAVVGNFLRFLNAAFRKSLLVRLLLFSHFFYFF